MGYTKKTWSTGDVITADAMNNLEEGASLQSDYTQTDSTQPDFIKNRPFYTEKAVLFGGENIAFDTSFNGMLSVIISPLSAGLTDGIYTVNWDGQIYECESEIADGAYAIGNLDLLMTGSDNGMPFIMMTTDFGDGTISAWVIDVVGLINGSTASTHTFSVIGDKVNPIDEKYLPASVRDGCDWENSDYSPKYIANKPFSRTLEQTITWDGDTTDKEVIVISNESGVEVCLCKIQDYTTPYNPFRGVVCAGKYNDGSLSSTQFAPFDSGIVYSTVTTVSVPDKSTLSCVIRMPSISDEYYYSRLGVHIDAGIYAVLKKDSAGNVIWRTSEIKLYSIETIPTAYLPEILKTITLVTSGITLNSSTNGSIKKFKITVDDNGTLTATEI